MNTFPSEGIILVTRGQLLRKWLNVNDLSCRICNNNFKQRLKNVDNCFNNIIFPSLVKNYELLLDKIIILLFMLIMLSNLNGLIGTHSQTHAKLVSLTIQPLLAHLNLHFKFGLLL